MKTLLLRSTTLLLLLQPLLTFAADVPDVPKEVTELLEDYLKEFSKAKEPADKVVSQQAGKIATKLSAEGRADEAKLVTTQAGDKNGPMEPSPR